MYTVNFGKIFHFLQLNERILMIIITKKLPKKITLNVIKLFFLENSNNFYTVYTKKKYMPTILFINIFSKKILTIPTPPPTSLPARPTFLSLSLSFTIFSYSSLFLNSISFNLSLLYFFSY